MMEVVKHETKVEEIIKEDELCPVKENVEVGKYEEVEEEPIRKKVKTDADDGVPITKVPNEDDFIPFSSSAPMQVEPPMKLPNRRSIHANPDLPIFTVKGQLLNLLQSHQVVVLTGNTGCGKSTQVPQILYNYMTDMDMKAKIVCTQPRRIAAITLAQRVSEEMGVRVGDLVGYQVGMDAHFGDATRVLFVTTGIFLQRLVHERENFFEEFTHIVMDEVHERDIDIDFALIIVKHFLKVYPKVKLVLMSATICSEKFSNYFSAGSIAHIDDPITIKRLQSEHQTVMPIRRETNAHEWGLSQQELDKLDEQFKQKEEEQRQQAIVHSQGLQFLVDSTDIPAPIISIKQGQRFPIFIFYLEQIKSFFSELNVKLDLQFRRNVFYNDEATIQEEITDMAIQLVGTLIDPKVMGNIKQAYSTPRTGSMLMFLPGYQEIMNMRDALIEKYGEQHIKLVLLHSTLTATAKDLAITDNTKFRIFLCTNIAESSITVPDCVFVMDFCLSKEIEYNPKNLTEKLSLSWCSQASANQRSGRAGRLFPGICFRLVPESFFQERMRPFSLCEMLRCPLEKIVLRIKKLDQLERDMIAVKSESHYKVRNMFRDVTRPLATALDPPATEQVGNSVQNLQRCGALKADDRGDLLITKLGLFMCEMPIDIFLTRFILISWLMGCPREGVTIAALLSQRRNFFQHNFHRDQKRFLDTLYQFDMGDEDDIVVYLRIYSEWEKLFYMPYLIENKLTSSNRMTLRKFTRERYKPKEIQYAHYRCVDLKNFREVLQQKYELLSRIESYYTINSEEGDLNDQEHVFKIKTAFAAAFHSKAILIQRELTKDIERRVGALAQKKLDPARTLILENVNVEVEKLPPAMLTGLKDRIALIFEEYCELNSFATKLELRHALIIDLHKNEEFRSREFLSKQQEYVREKAHKKARGQRYWVSGVEFSYGSILVHFSLKPELNELVSIFKRILQQAECERRDKYRKTGKTPDEPLKVINDPRAVSWLMQMTTFDDLVKHLNCQVIHTGQSRGYAQPNFKETQADQDSVNFIQLCFGIPKRDYNRFLVTYDVKEKDASKRNTARQASRISEPNHWMQTLAVLFGCNIQMVPNESKSHYEKAVVDGRTFYLDHYMLEEDITEFNYLRQKISDALLEKGDLTQDSLWPLIKKVAVAPRIKIHFDSDEKWVRVFEEDRRDLLKALQQDVPRRRLRLLGSTAVPVPQHQFMNDIVAERPDYNLEFPRQFDQEGLRLFTQMKRLYSEWKLEQIDHCFSLRFMVQRNEKAILVCRECPKSFDQVGSTRALHYLEDDDQFQVMLKGDINKTAWFRRELQSLHINIFSDRFELCENRNLINQFYEKRYLKELLDKLGLIDEPTQYHFITCPRKEHIFGICPKTMAPTKDSIQRLLLCNRTLALLYPNLEREELNFRLMKHDQLSVKEKEKYQQFQQKVQQSTFECKVCVNEYHGTTQGFRGPYPHLVKHVQSQQHRENIDQLNLYV